MRTCDVELKLKNAARGLAPDVLDDILSKCDGSRGKLFIMRPEKAARGWLRAVAAAAAALVLTAGVAAGSVWFGYNRVDALVTLDVNPSVALKVNRTDRVLAAEAGNADAVRILDGMDLKGVPVDVAINALVGSMLKYGYIQENANSVLLSVECADGADGEKTVLLQQSLAQSISRQLNMVNGAVISQNLASDAELRTLAGEYQISSGKAALIQKILNENSHLMFADLARLSVNELNLLVGSKRIVAEGMEAQGSASDKAYIGEDSAKRAALSHAGAGTDGTEVDRLRVELDYDDGLMVYDVEFYLDGGEYEYEINAVDGSVVQFDRDSAEGGGRREQTVETPAVTQNRADFIGETAAAEIAITHSSAPSSTVPKVELDKDDGVYIYEVEFESDGMEYDYEINATTGEILSWESEEG